MAKFYIISTANFETGGVERIESINKGKNIVIKNMEKEKIYII
jgi:hypothetical protein